MIYRLKVSPISYAILILEYPSHEQSGTIVATSHSLLAKLLSSRKPHSQQSTDHLTKEIYISTPKKMNITDDDLVGVAILLHEEHRYALMRWIQSSVQAGTTASYGIRSFMAHYDLDDDDLNQETTLRTWQRYVRTHVDLLQRPKDILLSPPARVWCEDTFELFIADIVEYLYNSQRHKWNKKRIKALRLTAYNSIPHIRKKMEPIGYESIRAAYDAINNTKQWIAQHKAVAKAWAKYYGKVEKV